MENQDHEQTPTFAAFGRRKVKPCSCVIGSKRHIRTFLCDVLDELGFITSQCADLGELNKCLHPQRPDLIVLASADGEEAAAMLKTLAAEKFGGKVLLLGPRASPLVAAVQELGEKLGLAMLPILHTPFDSANLRNSVAVLLPIEAPPLAPVDAGEAIGAGRLELWYQPKIDARTNAVAGAEALVRMRHPTWGIVTPAYFIPDDDDPQFHAISEFVVDQAIKDWHDFGVQSGAIEIAINLPIAFFQKPGAIGDLCRKLPDHPAFEGLIVEINALEVIRSLALAKAIARQVRFHNIGISIDDVGEEWSSLKGLEPFPFVELKVDRKFVTGCSNAPLKRKMCRQILDLADRYGIRTVAEGVETTDDLHTVREMGFDFVQGFLFGKPMSAKKFARTILGRPMAL